LSWSSPGEAWDHTGRNSVNPDDLHRELSQQLIERERLEQEVWRFGNQSKTKHEIEKKREIETALGRSSQHIQGLKQRLRGMGALAQR
jgi:hypothetical protein